MHYFKDRFISVKINLNFTYFFILKVDCSRLNGFIGLNDQIKQYILNNISTEDIEYFNAMLQICNASGLPKSYENITREEQKMEIKPTELRSNPVYYRIYYVHLNTIFASLIPLVSLLYLNIATVKALKKMVEVR